MKDNDVWQAKYSSVTEERTEENNCLNYFQHAHERCRKTTCMNEIINIFHY